MNPEPEKIILNYVKNSWPNVHITRENLAHPTAELVKEFYTNFLTDYYEKIQSWTGPHYSPLDLTSVEHLELEENLFLKMCPIMKMLNCKFMLSDIYEPISVRTKNFFLLCCHLLMFTEAITDDVEKISSTIMKTKEETNFLTKEHEQLLTKINEKATIKSELMDQLEKTHEELASTKAAYEQMQDLKAEKEKIHGDLKKQIEMLKREIQTEQLELDTLEAKEKELTEQVVSETEYINLKTIVSNLESQISTLGTDDIDIEDILLHENDVLLHYKDCQKHIPNVSDFAIDVINNLIECEEALKTEQINNNKLENRCSTLNSSKCYQEKKKTELSKSLENLREQLQLLEVQYLKTKEDYRNRLSELKDNIETQTKLNSNTVQLCQKNIKNLEEQMVRLKETFAKEYIKISETYTDVKNYYRSVLFKFEEQL